MGHKNPDTSFSPPLLLKEGPSQRRAEPPRAPLTTTQPCRSERPRCVRTPAFCVDVLARGRTALEDAAQRSALSVVGVTFLPVRPASGYAKSQTSRKPVGRGVNAVLVCQLGLDPLVRGCDIRGLSSRRRWCCVRGSRSWRSGPVAHRKRPGYALHACLRAWCGRRGQSLWLTGESMAGDAERSLAWPSRGGTMLRRLT